MYHEIEEMKEKNCFRNIIPNIIHQMVIFIQKKHKSRIYVESILKPTKEIPKLSTNRFYLYHTLVKEKMAHHLNEEILVEFQRIQEEKC